MKRIIFAILVLALTSLAALNAVDSFDVDTEVEGVNKMKITASVYSSTDPDAIETAAAFGSLTVQSAGDQKDFFKAWLSTMSNNRAGYTVKMSATAMKGTTTELANAYINYTVTVNGASITTANTTSSPTSIEVISVDNLTKLSVESKQIGLIVDSATFNSALEGSYSGTVTFTFSAK